MATCKKTVKRHQSTHKTEEVIHVQKSKPSSNNQSFNIDNSVYLIINEHQSNNSSSNNSRLLEKLSKDEIDQI